MTEEKNNGKTESAGTTEPRGHNQQKQLEAVLYRVRVHQQRTTKKYVKNETQARPTDQSPAPGTAFCTAQ